MTRFGIEKTDFQALAQLMAVHILNSTDIKDAVKVLRQPFTQMQYCFAPQEMGLAFEELTTGII